MLRKCTLLNSQIKEYYYFAYLDYTLLDLDLDQGIAELHDSLRCNLMASDGHKSPLGPEEFY